VLAQEVASKGYTRALWVVGNHYRDGVGVKQNYCEAFKYYIKAMELGNPNAIKDIGKIRTKAI
jgi:TPR repeat protein